MRTDVYENDFRKGCRVAFNYQGEMRTGKLLDVKFRKEFNGRFDKYTGKKYHIFYVSHVDNPDTIYIVVID